MRDLGWRPQMQGAASEVLGTYHNAQGAVSWYRGIYTEQHTGAKLIGYGNSAVPDDWTILSREVLQKSKSADYTPTLAEVLATTAKDPSGQSWRLWSWYVVAGHKAATPWKARMWLGLQGFELNRPLHSGLVILAAPCAGDCRQADRQLRRFNEQLDGEHR
jgi:EpsI family protein